MTARLSQSERHDIYKILLSRYEAKMTALNASDPGWKQRIEDRKNKVAIGRLRVEKEAIELTTVESQIRALENRKAEIELRIAKKMPLQKRVRYDRGCPLPMSLCEAVAQIAKEIHDAESAKDIAGRKALAIQAEFASANAQLTLCSTRDDIAARKIL